MLLTYGYEKVHKLWHVEENSSSIFLRIYWVIDGDATYHAQNITHHFKHNHVYIFPTNAPYSISHNPNNPLTCLYLHLGITPYVLSNFIEFDMEEDDILNHLCSAFLLLTKTSDLHIHSPLQQALSQSIIEYLAQKGAFETIDMRIMQSVNYIIKNLSQNITIEELGNASGYHPKYFSAIFKQNIGVSPHQFIIQYRMKHALILLQDGYSITETALAIGYSDVKSFSKMFF